MLPAVLAGVVWMAYYAARGYNPWRAIDTVAVSIWPAHTPRPPQLVELVALLAALVVVLALSSAWQIAVLGAAGREALLGGAVDVRASLENGRQRFLPVLLASLAVFGVPLAALAVPLALAASVAPIIERSNPNAAPDAAILAAASLGCLSLILIVAVAAVGVYVLTRLFIAPYIAATQPLDVRGAIVESWRLTSGHGRWWRSPWWRTIVPVVVVALIAGLVGAPFGNLELFSYALEMLVANPLIACGTAPLTALAAVVVLYDLRLRADGYNALHHKSST